MDPEKIIANEYEGGNVNFSEILKNKTNLSLGEIKFENKETESAASEILYQFKRDVNSFIASSFTREWPDFHIPYVDYNQEKKYSRRRDKRMTPIDPKIFNTQKIRRTIIKEIKELAARDPLAWKTMKDVRETIQGAAKDILEAWKAIDVRHKVQWFDTNSFGSMLSEDKRTTFDKVWPARWSDYLQCLYKLSGSRKMEYFKENSEWTFLEMTLAGKKFFHKTFLRSIEFMNDWDPVFDKSKVFDQSVLDSMQDRDYMTLKTEDFLRMIHQLFRDLPKDMSKQDKWEVKKHRGGFLNPFTGFLYINTILDEEELKEYSEYLNAWLDEFPWFKKIEEEFGITIHKKFRLKELKSIMLKLMWGADVTTFSDLFWFRLKYFPKPPLDENGRLSEEEVKIIARLQWALAQYLAERFKLADLTYQIPSKGESDVQWFEMSTTWIFASLKTNEKNRELIWDELASHHPDMNFVRKEKERSVRAKWQNDWFSASKTKAIFISDKGYSYGVEGEIVPWINANNAGRAHPEFFLVQKILSLICRIRVVCTINEMKVLVRNALERMYEQQDKEITSNEIDPEIQPELADALVEEVAKMNASNQLFTLSNGEKIRIKDFLADDESSKRLMNILVADVLTWDLRSKKPKFAPFLHMSDLDTNTKEELQFATKNKRAEKFTIDVDMNWEIVTSFKNVFFTSSNINNSLITGNVPCNAFVLTPTKGSKKEFYDVNTVYDADSSWKAPHTQFKQNANLSWMYSWSDGVKNTISKDLWNNFTNKAE